jgi:hypothetical protein
VSCTQIARKISRHHEKEGLVNESNPSSATAPLDPDDLDERAARAVKAVKADDAKVPVYIWDERVCDYPRRSFFAGLSATMEVGLRSLSRALAPAALEKERGFEFWRLVERTQEA